MIFTEMTTDWQEKSIKLLLENPNLTGEEIKIIGAMVNLKGIEIPTEEEVREYNIRQKQKHYNQRVRDGLITIKEVLENPDMYWNWREISASMRITIQDVLDNMEENWDWDILSCNRVVATQDSIMNNLQLPWEWDMLSTMNPAVTLEFIVNHPELPWQELSLNANFTEEDQIKYPNLAW